MTVVKCPKTKCKNNDRGICTANVIDVNNCTEIQTNESNNENKDLLLG